MNANNIAAKINTGKVAGYEDQEKTQNQYLILEPSFLEAFLANSANMLIDKLGRQHAYNTIADHDKTDLCESELLEPARLDQLDKQQKQ